MNRLIPVAMLCAMLLGGCAGADYRPETAAAAESRLVLDPTPSSARTGEFVQGMEALQAGSYARAEPLLRRALARQPNDPYAHLGMGALLERTGRHFEASTHYRSAELYGQEAPVSTVYDLDAGEDTAPAGTVAELAGRNLARLEDQEI